MALAAVRLSNENVGGKDDEAGHRKRRVDADQGPLKPPLPQALHEESAAHQRRENNQSGGNHAESCGARPQPARRSAERGREAAQAAQAVRADRAARKARNGRKRDSVWIPILTVIAVAGSLAVIFTAGYHFIEPILLMLDTN